MFKVRELVQHCQSFPVEIFEIGVEPLIFEMENEQSNPFSDVNVIGGRDRGCPILNSRKEL